MYFLEKIEMTITESLCSSGSTNIEELKQRAEPLAQSKSVVDINSVNYTTYILIDGSKFTIGDDGYISEESP